MTSALHPLPHLDSLPQASASDVKKHGWRGVMRLVGEQGKLVITNHSAPEAVVLSTREYKALVDAVRDELRQQPPFAFNLGAQQAHLMFHQGQGARGAMGQAQPGGQVRMAEKEVRVGL